MIFGEIFSSGRAILYKNPSDQIVMLFCRLLKLRLTSSNIMASEQNKSSPLVVEPLSPSNTEGRDEGGGGGSGLKTNSKPQSLDLQAATIEGETSSGTSLPMLLITANVGSIFDDPQSLIPQWVAQVSQQIKEQNPGFVAIHCQEVCRLILIN